MYTVSVEVASSPIDRHLICKDIPDTNLNRYLMLDTGGNYIVVVT
jgi:hypothetical protein